MGKLRHKQAPEFPQVTRDHPSVPLCHHQCVSRAVVLRSLGCWARLTVDFWGGLWGDSEHRPRGRSERREEAARSTQHVSNSGLLDTPRFARDLWGWCLALSESRRPAWSPAGHRWEAGPWGGGGGGEGGRKLLFSLIPDSCWRPGQPRLWGGGPSPAWPTARSAGPASAPGPEQRCPCSLPADADASVRPRLPCSRATVAAQRCPSAATVHRPVSNCLFKCQEEKQLVPRPSR